MRARYNSHKPGEEIFYQCADVAVLQQAKDDVSKGRNYHPEHRDIIKKMDKLNSFTTRAKYDPTPRMSLRGFSYTPLDPNNLYFVNVTMEGEVIPFGRFDMGIDFMSKRVHPGQNRFAKQTNSYTAPFLLNSVVTVSAFNNLVGIYHEGSIDDPAATYVEFDTHQGTLAYKSRISNWDGHPFSGIIYYKTINGYITFSIQSQGDQGNIVIEYILFSLQLIIN